MNEVTAPDGTSKLKLKSPAIAVQKVKNPAPIIIISGIKWVLLPLNKSLTIWGTTRPTKPIVPQTVTDAAVTSDAETINSIEKNLWLTPDETERSSPNFITSSTFENNSTNIKTNKNIAPRKYSCGRSGWETFPTNHEFI